MKKTNLNKKAFTLVELLVVIAIIAILFVVLVSKVDFATDKAKEVGVQTDFHSFQMAMQVVGMEYSGYSENLEDLAAQLNKNLDSKLEVAVNGTELESNGKDPWGTNYKMTYVAPVEGENRGTITVHSAGPDMTFGTSDDYNLSATYSINTDTPGVQVETNTGAGNITNDNNDENNNGGTQTPVEYEMTSHPNVVTEVSELVFISEADISKFAEFRIDENKLTENVDFVKTEGSTVITLTEDYVETLSVGYHTAKIVTNDGYSTCGFTLKQELPGLYQTNTIKLLKTWDTMINELDGAMIPCVEITSPGILNYFYWGYEGDLVVDCDMITSFNNNAFAGCSNLTKITFAQGNGQFAFRTIGANAFQGCTSLKEIILPDGLGSIGQGAFEGCTSLTRVLIPGTVRFINTSTFSGCTNLEEVILGEGVETIGDQAFYQCTKLSKINCPTTLTTIGSAAFGDCQGLKEFEYSGDITIAGAAFVNAGIKEVTIGSGITNIASETFSGCPLEKITIDSDVTMIDVLAFSGCLSTAEIFFNGTEAQWNSITVEWGNETFEECTVHFIE